MQECPKRQAITAVGLKRKIVGCMGFYGARSLFRHAVPRQRQIENIKLRIKRDSLKEKSK